MFRTTKLTISETVGLAYSEYRNSKVSVIRRRGYASEPFGSGASTCRYPERQEGEGIGRGRNSIVIMITVSPALSTGSFLRPKAPDDP